MRNSVFCLALGVGLLVGISIAHGQTPKPTLVAQAPTTVPPSGVLVTPPLAPVAVPPSGVLIAQPSPEARAFATASVKIRQRVRTAETTAPASMRHVVHRWTGARGVITRTTVRESMLAAPAVAITAAAEPINIVPHYYNFVTPPSSLGLRHNDAPGSTCSQYRRASWRDNANLPIYLRTGSYSGDRSV